MFETRRQNCKLKLNILFFISFILFSYYGYFITYSSLLLMFLEYLYFDIDCATKLLNRRHISPFSEGCVI